MTPLCPTDGVWVSQSSFLSPVQWRVPEWLCCESTEPYNHLLNGGPQSWFLWRKNLAKRLRVVRQRKCLLREKIRAEKAWGEGVCVCVCGDDRQRGLRGWFISLGWDRPSGPPPAHHLALSGSGPPLQVQEHLFAKMDDSIRVSGKSRGCVIGLVPSLL